MEDSSKLYFGYEITNPPSETEHRYLSTCYESAYYSEFCSLIDFYLYELRQRLTPEQKKLQIVRRASNTSVIIGFEVDNDYDLENIKDCLILLRKWITPDTWSEIYGKAPEFITAEINPYDEAIASTEEESN